MNNQNIEDQFKYASKLFDHSLLNNNEFTSILKLMIYFPFGLFILILRVLLIILLKILLKVIPRLKHDKYFVRLCCLTFGINAKLINSTIDSDDQNNLKIYVSNHVTCLDFYSIKYFINNLNYTNQDQMSYLRQSVNFFINLLEANESKKDGEDLYKVRANYPFLFCPERSCTNGRFGLLRFDQVPFDLVLSNFDFNVSIVPVCLKVSRPYMPLSITFSNDFLNTIFTLFAPMTVYEIEIMKKIENVANETSAVLSDRVRGLISKNLKLESTSLTSDEIKNIFVDYEAFLERTIQQQRQRNTNSNIYNNISTSQNRQISFADISRLALQIKDILPYVSFETIQRHVQQSSTLDIESVIASILDSNDQEEVRAEDESHSLLSMSSQENLNTSLKKNNSPTSSSFGHKPSEFKSFQEKKFELLNEARQRYLSKHTS